jgi:glycosyltransferase involved in cell wall biosynthesis
VDRILAALWPNADPYLVAVKMQPLRPEDITIAITVYDRQAYIGQAIRSAIAQRCEIQPKVIVIEDCSPNPTLRESVIKEFGHQIQYFRNPRRRGLFDNWNACIEACRTSWLCILHDDDCLEPTFVESMLELAGAATSRALYYGLGDIVDVVGQPRELRPRSTSFAWHELDLEEWTRYDPVCFPAQLFNIDAARAVGGFRASSHYTADWEMWFKLALAYGAVATNRVVARYREHHSIGRGTTAVDLSGRKYACVNMQRKRHIAWLREKRPGLRFDRQALFRESPLPSRFILYYGYRLSPVMLRYNAGLLLISTAPDLGYRLVQVFVRLFSWRSVRLCSWIFQLVTSRKP